MTKEEIIEKYKDAYECESLYGVKFIMNLDKLYPNYGDWYINNGEFSIYNMQSNKFAKILSYKSESKPPQYQIGIDTFERMEANCTLGDRIAFVKGNIDKYNWRDKGQDKQDFKKIINYAKWAIKQIDDEQKTN
jgi:hypothetical protein